MYLGEILTLLDASRNKYRRCLCMLERMFEAFARLGYIALETDDRLLCEELRETGLQPLSAGHARFDRLTMAVRALARHLKW